MPKDDFDFDLSAPVRRISDDKILESLARFIGEHEGKSLTTIAYDEWPKRVCTSATVSERFGSWRAALARLGAATGVQERRYDPLYLMDNLERIWRELGYPPGKRRVAQYGDKISERPYVNRWGRHASCFPNSSRAFFQKRNCSADHLPAKLAEGRFHCLCDGPFSNVTTTGARAAGENRPMSSLRSTIFTRSPVAARMPRRTSKLCVTNAIKEKGIVSRDERGTVCR